MIAEFGHYCLILAAWVALAQAVLPLAGSAKGHSAWQQLARPASAVQALLLLSAFSALGWSFAANDFSVVYVAQHSNTSLPLAYRLAAVWGGHEGSLLLWVLLLSLWTLAVAVFSRSLPLVMVARVIGVLGLVSSGFLAFILTLSNPFLRMLPAAAEGRDLNPLLQDFGLIVHPPMLYMGYVGLSVAFAFAIAALLSGRLDAAWARWSRPWTTVAWVFLTVGIALGSWWAYYELGWGGWWFWDPVENASLMPWLFATALIHSLMVTDQRGSFKAWTVLLAIGAFSLSLLGTFLVRSGVLTSVHAFAADPGRGVFILLFLAAVVGSSLSLFAWRAPRVTLGGQMAPVSRESFLLLNSVLLGVATAAVLLGTVYPLIVDALQLGKLSVGAPYFNAVFVPLMVPVLFLMVPGLWARWKQDGLRPLSRKLWPVALASLAIGGLLPLALSSSGWGPWQAACAMGLSLACWVVLGSLQQMAERLRKPGRIATAYWGMHLAHLGLALVVAGITLVKTYEVERHVRMAVGDSVTVHGHRFELLGVRQVQGPNYQALQADVEVTRDGQSLTHLRPEKRQYTSSGMPMTEAAIDYGFTRDLYVSLGEPIEDSRPAQWALRVFYKPFISWLWGGGLLMVLGGLIAAADRRYRRRAAALAPDNAAPAGAGA
jgi:cytochrome c-type biogenesis protein CcmF